MITTPLILPFVLWGAVAVASLFTAAKLSGFFDDPKKNKLGILGMELSGKTTFLDTLGAKVKIGQQTTLENYESFEYTLDNNNKIYIEAGKDIGGSRTYFSQYTNIIKNSDIIFYFLDIKRYLDNSIDIKDNINYRRDCNSRLDLINTYKADKKIVVFATHSDLLTNQNDSKKKFHDLMQEKKYSEILEEVIFINLTNTTETKSVINKIFNGK